MPESVIESRTKAFCDSNLFLRKVYQFDKYFVLISCAKLKRY